MPIGFPSRQSDIASNNVRSIFQNILGILVLIRTYFFFGCASSTVPFGRQTIHVHSQVVLAKTKYLRDSEFQDIYRFQSKLAAI